MAPPTASDCARLAAVAHHEAGHAVVALALGRRLRLVSIIPRGPHSLGRCLHGPDPSAPLGPAGARAAAERAILIYLAGPAAMYRFVGAGRDFGADQDLEKAHALTCEVCRGDARAADAYYNRMKDRALRIVSDPRTWTRIEALAAALLERRELGGWQVRRICREAVEEVAAAPR